ncbi:acetyl-CoA carboxylase biotin carboxylase subunit [Kocuria dechangensis]|uniref:biotin carboxylase n=1 Tax=Kocuria dechangensis TaxID=1176249 RepID=A0A917GW01_9MICC|nr:biotin carboxylase N-terminal domain-containing protein [Kocuria dechangensis]GGG58240.1 acetyl-CoA carboxylase biotin carboxylase subunit [Kocuria dechangensis]
MAISTLLVANRGEIAVRIIRSAQDMGIRTVLAVSEIDQQSLAAELADVVAVVGPAPAQASYLNAEAIVIAGKETGCDAVHPGYGFLSENAAFARRVQESGMTWVGPDPDVIDLMGHKTRALEAAIAADVPVLPGSNGPLEGDDDAVLALAREVGFPLVIKASAGGGGRGIRLVRAEEDLLKTVDVARAEASASFGDPTVYLERYVERARHVEVQVLGDGETFLHLGDRDCSLQRRSQKIVEEAPAPDLPDHVRERIRESAVNLARLAGYTGVGTVEYLYDPVRHEAAFIEMNTRLQVEHPVTEFVTGVDLVAEQLRIASTGRTELRQEDIRFDGHSIECRINAEDPDRNFLPSPGTLTRLDWPEGEDYRVDTGVRSGDTVAPFYDSLLAKLVVHGHDRAEAVRRMSEGLAATHIEGIKTTVPLLARLVTDPVFEKVGHWTTYIETEMLSTGSPE